MTVSSSDPRLVDLLNRLDLEAKAALLTGRDMWSTVPLPQIGLRSMVLSDGPSGVRGAVWDERDPSLNLPSGSALGASWDPDLAEHYGRVSATEAHRKGVHVVLGPTINLHRSPRGGRHFEAFSEDPLLTGVLAAAYVRGVQSLGVAATPKHYVANDSETDRFTVDVRVDERTLRELYLAPFERAVVDGDAWAIMSAYNSINGVTATENDLLETPLNSEWGFDGIVVSDWTAVRSLDAASASQDLVMPGPAGPWGSALVDAVRDGRVAESAVDRKVLRMLALAARVGALDGFEPRPAAGGLDGRAFAREAAVRGAVLVSNDGTLPLTPAPQRIAVIGDLADRARTQGGGSATVIPESVVSPLAGIRAAFPGSEVRFARGAIVQSGLTELDLAELRDPETGEAGVRIAFLGEDGEEIFVEHRRATRLVWIGGDAPVGSTHVVEATTTWTPTQGGPTRFGFSGVGDGEVLFDGVPVVSGRAEAVGDDLGAALLSPGTLSQPVDVEAGRPIEVRVRFRREIIEQFAGFLSFGFGVEEDGDAAALLAEAEAVAREADVVVLVVGTSAEVESEGFDRADLRLPGTQDELAERIIAANPRTIAVVAAGAPVELPWRDRAAAVLLAWFGGQEVGAALGDILTGAAEPGGRLPTTWPARLGDAPVSTVEPDARGQLHYAEGGRIGYRAWLDGTVTPAYPFGFGLGYTSWSFDAVVALAPLTLDGETSIAVTVTNTGARTGRQVVQLYAERPGSAVDLPGRWLVGFGAVTAERGETVVVEIPVRGRELAYWDAGWRVEPGEVTLVAAAHVGDPGIRTTVTLS